MASSLDFIPNMMGKLSDYLGCCVRKNYEGSEVGPQIKQWAAQN